MPVFFVYGVRAENFAPEFDKFFTQFDFFVKILDCVQGVGKLPHCADNVVIVGRIIFKPLHIFFFFVDDLFANCQSLCFTFLLIKTINKFVHCPNELLLPIFFVYSVRAEIFAIKGDDFFTQFDFFVIFLRIVKSVCEFFFCVN